MELLTQTQLATIARVPQSRIRHWVKTGELQTIDLALEGERPDLRISIDQWQSFLRGRTS